MLFPYMQNGSFDLLCCHIYKNLFLQKTYARVSSLPSFHTQLIIYFSLVHHNKIFLLSFYMNSKLLSSSSSRILIFRFLRCFIFFFVCSNCLFLINSASCCLRFVFCLNSLCTSLITLSSSPLLSIVF